MESYGSPRGLIHTLSCLQVKFYNLKMEILLKTNFIKREHSVLSFFIVLFLKKHLFNFDCAGSSLLQRLFSSCSEWGLLSRCNNTGFLLKWLLLLQSLGPRAHRWTQHLRLQGSGAQPQQLWCMG